MQLRYVEYGKVFRGSPAGTFDFSVLNRSDDNIVANTKDFYFKHIATLDICPKQNTKTKNNSVTLAFFPWDEVHYLFLQMQQRHEGEFGNVEIARSFNQSRFVFINKKNIRPNKFGLATSLVMENPTYPGARRLPDYVYPVRGEIKNEFVEEKSVPHSSDESGKIFLERIIDALYSRSQIKPVSMATVGKVPSRMPTAIFIDTDLCLDEQIRYFDEIQYWLYPALGVISFATNHIVYPDVTLCLSQDLSLAKHLDKEKVFDEHKLSQCTFISYFDAVCNLPETDLYHKTLEYYLRMDIHPETAVKIFRLIETDMHFSVEDVIDTIRSNLELINDQDFVTIVKKRLSNEESDLKQLLLDLPIQKRFTLLELMKKGPEIQVL